MRGFWNFFHQVVLHCVPYLIWRLVIFLQTTPGWRVWTHELHWIESFLFLIAGKVGIIISLLIEVLLVGLLRLAKIFEKVRHISLLFFLELTSDVFLARRGLSQVEVVFAEEAFGLAGCTEVVGLSQIDTLTHETFLITISNR